MSANPSSSSSPSSSYNYYLSSENNSLNDDRDLSSDSSRSNSETGSSLHEVLELSGLDSSLDFFSNDDNKPLFVKSDRGGDGGTSGGGGGDDDNDYGNDKEVGVISGDNTANDNKAMVKEEEVVQYVSPPLLQFQQRKQVKQQPRKTGTSSWLEERGNNTCPVRARPPRTWRWRSTLRASSRRTRAPTPRASSRGTAQTASTRSSRGAAPA